jgi:hypothetical protein
MPARAFCRAGLPGSTARCPQVFAAPAPPQAGNIPTEAFKRSLGIFPFWEDGNVPRNAGECSIGPLPCDPPAPKPPRRHRATRTS